VSDALLRYLIDPVMDRRLKSAYDKLDELMAVHKEHPETRNHYFTDRYNALQRNHSEAEVTKALERAFETRSRITEGEIPHLVAMIREKTEVDMDLVAARSTFNAMEAFYKARRPNTCHIYCTKSLQL
jgi:hypothetical protein